jgi:hypothetical protein
MNTTNTMKVLARRDEITDEEWMGLLSQRMSSLKHVIRKMTLPSVGNLRPVYCQYQNHTLSKEPKLQIECHGEKLSGLDTRGVLPIQRHQFHRHTKPVHVPRNHREYTGWIWGLTRDYDWFIVEVQVRHETVHRDDKPGDYRIYTNAVKVIIRQSSLSEVLKVCETNPCQIWYGLGSFIEEWAEQRKRLYEEAQKYAEVVRIENLVAEAGNRK